jgi:hypothetical protein|uniref:Uncharacterized protein n=1 Tax=viral metagenome TaxID=1070528 RepID=A0A6C0KR59_9ZZZZ
MVFKNIRLKKCKREISKEEEAITTAMTESSIAYHCINFLKSEEIKKEMSSIINPIMDYFLKQIHIYLYFFLFFIFISFVLHLGVLFLLLKYNIRFKKLYNKLNKLQL